jgi:hypothetical protein
VQEAGGFVQAYCRIINDHVQPCGSGRLGVSCHSLSIIAKVRKKSRVSFDAKSSETHVGTKQPSLAARIIVTMAAWKMTAPTRKKHHSRKR